MAKGTNSYFINVATWISLIGDTIRQIMYLLTWNTLEPKQKQNPNITEYYAEYLTLIYKE